VFGDRYRNAVHLGERDCSVQRRHQKLIEKAPSPAVSPRLRAQMGEVAVSAVKSIGYEGAGTLEFLLDQSGGFYFMDIIEKRSFQGGRLKADLALDPLTKERLQRLVHELEEQLRLSGTGKR